MTRSFTTRPTGTAQFAVALGIAVVVAMLLVDATERRWGMGQFLSFASLLLWFLYQGYADDSQVFEPVPFFLAVGVVCLALGSTGKQLLDRRPVWRQLSIRSWYGVFVFAGLADWGLLWEALCTRYGCGGYPSVGASVRIVVQNPILWTIAAAPLAMQLGIWLMSIRDVAVDRVGEPLVSRFFRFAWRRVWDLSWTRVVVPSLAVAATLEVSQLRSVGFDASLSDIGQSFGFTITAVILLAAGWLYLRPVSWTAGLVAVVGLLVLHDASWLYAGILLALLGGPTAALNRRIGRPTWRTTAAAASVAGMFVGTATLTHP